MAEQTKTTIAYLHITMGPASESIRLQGKLLRDNPIAIDSKTNLVIGRNPQLANLQIYSLADVSSVSRVHCSIHYDAAQNRFMLIDEGSTNGTYINDERMKFKESRELKFGDTIELGRLWRQGVQFLFSAEKLPIEVARTKVVISSEQKPKELRPISVSTIPKVSLYEKADVEEAKTNIPAVTIDIYEIVPEAASFDDDTIPDREEPITYPDRESLKATVETKAESSSEEAPKTPEALLPPIEAQVEREVITLPDKDTLIPAEETKMETPNPEAPKEPVPAELETILNRNELLTALERESLKAAAETKMETPNPEALKEDEAPSTGLETILNRNELLTALEQQSLKAAAEAKAETPSPEAAKEAEILPVQELLAPIVGESATAEVETKEESLAEARKKLESLIAQEDAKPADEPITLASRDSIEVKTKEVSLAEARKEVENLIAEEEAKPAEEPITLASRDSIEVKTKEISLAEARKELESLVAQEEASSQEKPAVAETATAQKTEEKPEETKAEITTTQEAKAETVAPPPAENTIPEDETNIPSDSVKEEKKADDSKQS